MTTQTQPAKNPLSILLTGATAGIGRHVALHLARQGHRVFATGRNGDALAELQAEAAGTALVTLVLDVTDLSSILAAKKAVMTATENRGLDVLINNAGYGQVGPLELVTTKELRAQLETNVVGLHAVTRAFVPAMRERGAGRVINISSIGGRMTMPLMGAYHASKYAVEALSDALRHELSPFGVKVVVVEPGPIQSEFSDRAVATLGEGRGKGTAYEAIAHRAASIQARVDKTNAGPEVVARAIDRAITARRPAARYVVPFRSRVVLAAMEWLPTRLTDGLITAFLRWANRPMKPAVAPPAASGRPSSLAA